jgi:pyruvate dehydrogenase E2 component (dihydrolipoamide acetyltransferase)
MAQKITMPSAGQNTDELTLLEWKKKVGDTVQRGDALFEVETDKASLEVESFAQGVLLKRLYEEGDTVLAGAVVAYVGKEGEDISSLEEDTPPTDNSQSTEIIESDEYYPISKERKVTSDTHENQPNDIETQRAKTVLAENIEASPAAKKLARDYGISLNAVSAFFSKSRIKEADVKAYYIKHKEPSDVVEEVGEDSIQIPLTSMRRTIAKRMVASVSAIPSFHVETAVTMEAAIALRNTINTTVEDKIGFHDLLAMCIATAVKDYPLVNAEFSEDHITVHKRVHVGLAVSVDNGLVVPVVRDVQKKKLVQLSQEYRSLIQKARDGELSPQDMNGGTITISNLGMYPISRFDAIIMPPQSAIFAISAIEDTCVAQEGAVVIKPVMTITGTFDHRVVDGAYAAQFLKRLKELMENPGLLLA